MLPRPEQLGTDPGPFGQLTDPNVARSGIGRGLVALLFVHARTVQAIDSILMTLTTDETAGTLSTGPRQTLDRRRGP